MQLITITDMVILSNHLQGKNCLDHLLTVLNSRAEDDVDTLTPERIVEVEYLERCGGELGIVDLLHLNILRVTGSPHSGQVLLIIIRVRIVLPPVGHD